MLENLQNKIIIDYLNRKVVNGLGRNWGYRNWVMFTLGQGNTITDRNCVLSI